MKQPTLTWIPEEAAAKMLGYRPDYFRRKVKALKISISYRNTNGRKYQYSRADMEKFMQETSTAV